MPCDNKGSKYVEVESWREGDKVEKIRLTYIEKGFDGGPTIRIQVRSPNGKLRKGPEIRIKIVSEVVKSLIDLIRSPAR